MKDELRVKLTHFWYSHTSGYKPVPEHLHEGILRYVCDGIRPGEFLTRVLQNDLRGAFRCADHKSACGIEALMAFLDQSVPEECWGSEGRFNAWLFSKRHGIR